MNCLSSKITRNILFFCLQELRQLVLAYFQMFFVVALQLPLPSGISTDWILPTQTCLLVNLVACLSIFIH